MPDTTPFAAAIAAGIAERELLAAIAHRFPDMIIAELSQALQLATAAAERKVLRPH
jgi:hypothetical protein